MIESQEKKKRIRSMLEDCETSMVNGEKNLIDFVSRNTNLDEKEEE